MKFSSRKYIDYLKSFDWYIFFGTLFLVAFGMVAIYSFELGKEIPDFFFFKRQLLAAVMGIFIMFAMSFIDYRVLLSKSRYAYIFALILLTGVLLAGATFRGTRGWFTIAGFNFQVVELAKVILLVFLTSFFTRFGRSLHELRYIFASGFFTAIFFVLVLFQPDLGSALILFFLWLGYILLIGTKKKNFLILLGGFIFLVGIAWFGMLQDYQKHRIMTFIDPASDPQGQGYNITQARIAIGSGEWFGRGVGLGTQSQLRFLPAAHTDFIIAVVSEEFGFLGVMSVLFFYGFIFYRIVRAANIMKDDSSALLLLGVVILLSSQMFINIGMNVGLLPVTGIALPFMSYGGSSLFVSFLLIGIVESIIIHKRSGLR